MGRKKRERERYIYFTSIFWLLWTFTVCVTGCGSKLEGPGSWPEETERKGSQRTWGDCCLLSCKGLSTEDVVSWAHVELLLLLLYREKKTTLRRQNRHCLSLADSQI
ncbi:hypothetical protein GHT06_009414 [Daphnia sinensis]|uniref:Uncharacterized protein n=1 Tax=Daphnia sinensis TaxID=1820382 RepID=A0AAD5PZU6_9CRUS|nr:hypothetical protein GHT06_009414 [Daphnia sinensis]